MTPVEIYVLCETRTVKCAQNFLNAFIPEREAAATEFPIPQFSDEPNKIYRSPDELIFALEREPCNEYSLYWNSTSDDDCQLLQAMLFFTTDGGMIAGLAVTSSEPVNFLNRLADVVSGRYGYITGEAPPPTNTEEFMRICSKSQLPSLVDGVIRLNSN